MKGRRFLSIVLGLGLLGGIGLMGGNEKTVKAAESPWFTPADVIFVDENSPQKYQANRQFICSGGIEVTGDRIWAMTFSGGPTEPHKDNYATVAFSDDKGKTWNDPFIVIDNLTYEEETRIFDSQLWKDPNGKLWIFYTQTGGEGDLWGGANSTYPQACFAYVIENPSADVEDLIVTDKGMLIQGGRIFSKPIVVDNNGTDEWLVSSHVNWTEYTDCYSSTDKGETWVKKGSAKGVGCGAHEAWIAQLSDGTLMMEKRIDNKNGVGEYGGVEVSYSYDLGKTWSPYENNLGEPFVAPGSRMNLYKLASGNLLFIANADAKVRTNLTVFMSTDDGMTWEHSLLLDDRDDPTTSWVENCTYPDVTQTADGTIYVAWDYDRTGYAETRFSAFTEQDIINGTFSKDCIYRRPIFKNNNTHQDVVGFDRFGGIPQAFNFGTTKAEIANSQLSEMTIYLSDGSEYEVTGSWDSEDFVANKAGEYKFTFTPDNFPAKAQDVQGVLAVYITVLEQGQVGVTGLEISNLPEKVDYKVGEELDLTGLVVKAKLSDGGKKTLKTSDYAVSGYDKNKIGEQTVTVSYGGQTATFTVTVGESSFIDEILGGCASTSSVGTVCALGALGIVAIKRRKENEKE